MQAPNVTIVTIMKDEGPFILEWIAWNQMIGVTHFIVMTNDCSDGTDEMLDRLAVMGLVTHVPNPFVIMKQPGNLHRVALRYALHFRSYKQADWIFHTDVDEFLTLTPGIGTIGGLIEASQGAHAISVCETLFGCSGVEHFEDKPLTAQFTHAMRLDPPEKQARRGVKTLFRNVDFWRGRKNHRPIPRARDLDAIKWVDGSGQPAPQDFVEGREPGLSCIGRHDNAVLHHYSVRSLDSFLTKLHRGDAVKTSRTNAIEYWQERNQNTEKNVAALSYLPELEKRLMALKSDPELGRLHAQSVKTHQDRIAEMRANKEMGKTLGYLKETIMGHPDFAK